MAKNLEVNQKVCTFASKTTENMSEINEQVAGQIDRLLGKVADKFPANVEATLITDIHLRANGETGELVAFDDDDNELTRVVVEQWIDSRDEDFCLSATKLIRRRIEAKAKKLEQMSIIKPFSFVLEDDERESVAELYVVDGDTVIIDEDMMKDLDKDLDDFLKQLLSSEE